MTERQYNIFDGRTIHIRCIGRGEFMDTDQKKLIGEIISNKRNEIGLTQQELGEKSNLSRSYIADIEGGRYSPSIKSLVSIASVLNLNLNFLLNKEQ